MLILNELVLFTVKLFTVGFLLVACRFVFLLLFQQLWVDLRLQQRHDFGQVVSVSAGGKTQHRSDF